MITKLQGERVRDARRKHKHLNTLKKLSDKTGIAVSTLSDIERGQCNPAFATMHKITMALNVDLDHIANATLSQGSLLIGDTGADYENLQKYFDLPPRIKAKIALDITWFHSYLLDTLGRDHSSWARTPNTDLKPE